MSSGAPFAPIQTAETPPHSNNNDVLSLDLNDFLAASPPVASLSPREPNHKNNRLQKRPLSAVKLHQKVGTERNSNQLSKRRPKSAFNRRTTSPQEKTSNINRVSMSLDMSAKDSPGRDVERETCGQNALQGSRNHGAFSTRPSPTTRRKRPTLNGTFSDPEPNSVSLYRRNKASHALSPSADTAAKRKHSPVLSPQYQFKTILKRLHKRKSQTLDERMRELVRELEGCQKDDFMPPTPPQLIQERRKLMILYSFPKQERIFYRWKDRNRRDIATKIYDYGKVYPTSARARGKSAALGASKTPTKRSISTGAARKKSTSLIKRKPDEDTLSFTVHSAQSEGAAKSPNRSTRETPPLSDKSSHSHGDQPQSGSAFITTIPTGGGISPSNTRDETTDCVPQHREQSLLPQPSFENPITKESLMKREDQLQRELARLHLQLPSASNALVSRENASRTSCFTSVITHEPVEHLYTSNSLANTLESLSAEQIQEKLQRVRNLRHQQHQLLRDLEGRFMAPSLSLYEKIESVKVDKRFASKPEAMEDERCYSEATSQENRLHHSSISSFWAALGVEQKNLVSPQPAYTKYDLQNIEVTIENDEFGIMANTAMRRIWQEAEVQLKGSGEM
uniref:Uncharacterized protein n=1 Tax=Percolomonas cosmopolitus TaxID=63605 RepID=A0A7S1KP78_9EUKA